MSTTENWLKLFQNKVNENLGSNRLKFTVDIWNPSLVDDGKNDKVKVVKDACFPFWIWNCIGTTKI